MACPNTGVTKASGFRLCSFNDETSTSTASLNPSTPSRNTWKWAAMLSGVPRSICALTASSGPIWTTGRYPRGDSMSCDGRKGAIGRSATDPFVLMGDFNARERSAPIQFLKGKAYLKTKVKGGEINPTPLLDTFRLQHPDRRNVVTFHGFRRFVFRFRFDYIFVPSSIRVQDAKIIQLRWKKCYPSDHFPLLARIDIPESFIDSNSDQCPEEMIPIQGAR
jgi:hypothetical protein